MVSPDSHRITRVRRYSGTKRKSHGFRIRGCHPLWQAFPHLSANQSIFYFHMPGPTTPERQAPLVWAVPRSLATTKGISLISFPSGTKMFQFPECPSQCLCVQQRDDRGSPLSGFPIRKSSDQHLYTATRGLSQCPTSFIGTWRQGIHHRPLVA